MDPARGFAALGIQEDPEAVFQQGWILCDVGEYPAGLACFDRAVANGYFVSPTLPRASQFDALRSEPAFTELMERADPGSNWAPLFTADSAFVSVARIMDR